MGTITALLSARSISASDIAESLAPKSTLSSAATFFPIKRPTPSPLPTAAHLTLILGLLCWYAANQLLKITDANVDPAPVSRIPPVGFACVSGSDLEQPPIIDARATTKTARIIRNELTCHSSFGAMATLLVIDSQNRNAA